MQSRKSTSASDATTPLPGSAGPEARLIAGLLDELAARPPESLGTSFGDDLSSDWLDDASVQAAAAARADLARLAARVGSEIGPYRLTALLGRGGMGAVFAAERSDGTFSQRVALKLVRSSGDGSRLVSRFRRERAILARLEHPHIARLLDGGVTPDGEPWFAMELIEGEALAGYAERAGLDLRQRVELFLQICDAVAYAHRMLVVHRDLKPANVLVDRDGQAKLLDFGIAKLLDRGTGDTLVTRADERVLTPDYAAPEQVLGQAITTTTDVYALGLLLFEMLTGERAQALHGKSALEAERWVVNREVMRPSATAAAHAHKLRGDVDAIVGKALRKEPERRYESAQAFGEDLRRWLSGHAVRARGDAWSYRARRFLVRHRWGIAASFAVLLALLVGLIAALWQANEARQQAERAQSVKNLALEMFRGFDPRVTRDGGRAITAVEMVDAGVKRLDAQSEINTEDRGELQTFLADMYFGLGRPEQARALLRANLARSREIWGEDDPRLLPALTMLAQSLHAQAGRDEVQAMLDQAERILALQPADAYHDQRVTLLQSRLLFANRGGDYVESTKLAEQILEMQQRRFGVGSPETAVGLLAVAWALNWQDRYEESEKFYRLALEVRGVPSRFSPGSTAFDSSPIGIRMRLAELNGFRGRYREARDEVVLAQEIALREYGEESASALYLRHAKLLFESQLGAVREALAGLSLLAEDRQRLGIPSSTFDQWRIAGLHLAVGHVAEAESMLRDHVAKLTESTGAEAKLTQFGRRDLGAVLLEAGKLEEAETILRAAMERLHVIHGRSDGYQAAQAESRYARARLERGYAGDAEQHARHAWVVLRDFLGPDRNETARAEHELGRALIALGRHEEGVEHLRAAAASYAAQYGEEDLRTATFQFELGDALRDTAPGEARRLLDASARVLVAPDNELPIRARAERWLARAKG